ncbi:MAG: hypothetical protein Q4P33_08125 [Flaviflexus sp.]|nr:hypothetical protein [Flaviflexus sp.]
MKRFALIAAGALVLAGCSDSSGTEEETTAPEEVATEATTEPAETEEATTEAATEEPSEEATTDAPEQEATAESAAGAVSHDCASVTLPSGMNEQGGGVWASDNAEAKLICLNVHSAGEAKGKRVGEIKREVRGRSEVHDVEVREDHYSFRIELGNETINEYGVFEGGKAAILSWTGDDSEFRSAADTLEVK